MGQEASDRYLFNNWIQDAGTGFETITELFEKYSFYPLPLHNSQGQGSQAVQTLLIKAITKEPKLLPLALGNGLQLSLSSVDALIRSVFNRAGSTPEKIVEDLKEVTTNEEFFISKTVASQIVFSNLYETEAPIAYSALKLLQFSPNQILRFDLADLVKELLASVLKKGFTSEVSKFMDRVLVDFPSAEVAIEKWKTIAKFLKAEDELDLLKETSDLEALKDAEAVKLSEINQALSGVVSLCRNAT